MPKKLEKTTTLLGVSSAYENFRVEMLSYIQTHIVIKMGHLEISSGFCVPEISP